MLIAMRGRFDAETRDHHDSAWLAWHMAALMRVKKLPKLDTLVGKKAKRPAKKGVRKTPEELLAKAEAAFAKMEE